VRAGPSGEGGRPETMIHPERLLTAWANVGTVNPRAFKCGHCGNDISSEKGYVGVDGGGRSVAQIHICHHCLNPTFFDESGTQVPGAAYGAPVQHISDESVRLLYEEARNCVAASAFTAAVLCCRKLLMNIAVAKNAQEGQTFAQYVQYLSDQHYVPPDAKPWVDRIRQKGNEANHEIELVHRGDAEQLLRFVEMLLRLIYEFPATIAPKTPSEKQT